MVEKPGHERRNEKMPASNLSDCRSYHIPVLLNEVIEGLNINEDGVYVDCTFGGGGHSKAILEKLSSKGRLVAFDQDKMAQKNLINDDRIIFVPENFKYLKKFLRLYSLLKVNGILADLGVSSHQLDEADRGFSIRYDADLDMRMNQRQHTTAADVIKQFTEKELHKMLEQYGEVTNAKTLAKTIVQQRGISPIKTISQFKQAVQSVVKGNPQKYFAQVFQALRIQVNDELGALQELLKQAVEVLKPKGRIAVITFHSLEDRIVKNFFKTGDIAQNEETENVFGIKKESPFKVITKKPILPSIEELNKNSRSRSAKLRIAERK